jgi:hypothetical protein
MELPSNHDNEQLDVQGLLVDQSWAFGVVGGGLISNAAANQPPRMARQAKLDPGERMRCSEAP